MINEAKTEHELIALLNYLEGEYKELRRKPDSELEKIASYHVQKALKNTYDFRGFIEKVVEDYAVGEAVDLLLASKYSDQKRALSAITSALRATEEPKYVELAEKIQKVHSTRTTEEAREKKRAIFLFEHIAEDRFYTVKVKAPSYARGRNVPKQQLKAINKQAKKEGTNRRAVMNKYSNVANIYIPSFYRDIDGFFTAHKEDFKRDARNGQIRETVLEHRHDFIEFLEKHKSLQFVKKQKLGKIK